MKLIAAIEVLKESAGAGSFSVSEIFSWKRKLWVLNKEISCHMWYFEIYK